MDSLLIWYVWSRSATIAVEEKKKFRVQPLAPKSTV